VLQTAERKGPPPVATMFSDIYRDMPVHLVEQQEEMLAHAAKYPDKYRPHGAR
jgi:hypothetical protein